MIKTALAVLPPRELWRVTPDGEVTTFAFDCDVRSVGVTGETVWVAVAHDTPDGAPPSSELVRITRDGERTVFAVPGFVYLVRGTADALVVMHRVDDDRPDVWNELVRYPRAALLP